MTEKVLVIDDHFASAQTLMFAMEAMGHDVRIALDGKAALREAKNFIPDIILCDIKLPDINGHELCKQFKADPRLHETFLLAQTGCSSDEDKQQSYEAGFHYHLVKPIDINKLLELVYLDRRARRQGGQKQQKSGSA